MASIFTFDPEPPRVLSPWLASGASTPQESDPRSFHHQSTGLSTRGQPTTGQLQQSRIIPNVTGLHPEPQAGPVEYKLHLLLRPRRTYAYSSTGFHVSGSQHLNSNSPSLTSLGDGVSVSPSPIPRAAPQSAQSRQNRLQQLTTQLLWRLQQSAPYHSSARQETPSPGSSGLAPLNEAGKDGSNRLSSAIRNVEESIGALYELGVADDGKFAGLAGDEIEESLDTLKGMASSLGCEMEVMRKVVVGDCAWDEEVSQDGVATIQRRMDQLWVAEAFVKPILGSTQDNSDRHLLATESQRNGVAVRSDSLTSPDARSAAEQLRVSLAGATTSGKSTLLGTLSTATLDNGRGKSRLSLLKHRHELASGLTSTVAPELLGYTSDGPEDNAVPTVINYASEGVASWSDMHARTKSGRLVFFADSAGHPRYRRTAVRGLVGWAPHWTLLCVAADSDEVGMDAAAGSEIQERLALTESDHHLSMAHLNLCLSLHLPLVVVITKLDLATRESLRRTLSKILTTLKDAGRQPVVVSANSSQQRSAEDRDLHTISAQQDTDVDAALSAIRLAGPEQATPIVLTSAVNAAGLMTLHALLRRLPVPLAPSQPTDFPPSADIRTPTLFHVEEVFSVQISSAPSVETQAIAQDYIGSVVSGHVRYGEIRLGAELLIGPFPSDDVDEKSTMESGSLSVPTPPRISVSPRGRMLGSLAVEGGSSRTEWSQVKVVSIRNMRQPVGTLLTGQVGTIGIIPVPPNHVTGSNEKAQNGFHDDHAVSYRTVRGLRKGMVLGEFTPHDTPPKSQIGFIGRFPFEQALSIPTGSLVVVYIASVRASARVTQVRPDSTPQDRSEAANEEDLPFLLEERHSLSMSRIFFEYTTGREWVEVGSQVLVMPGGGPGLFGVFKGKGSGGLEALVGSIVEVMD